MTANYIPASVPFKCKPTKPNPSPHLCMIWLSQGKCLPMLITQGQVQLGTVSPDWSLLKCKLANPKTAYPIYPALPVPSCRTHTKGSCSYFPLSLCLLALVLLCVALVACLLFLGNFFLRDSDFHACVSSQT